MAQIVTGFHAIEEKVRRALDSGKIDGLSIQLAKTGPRIKKILESAKRAGIPVINADKNALDSLVKVLPEVARDHRGIVMVVEGAPEKAENDTRQGCSGYRPESLQQDPDPSFRQTGTYP